MSLFDRLRASRDASIQRHVDRALAPEPERDNLLAAARERTWAAEDARRAMATRLEDALEQLRLAIAANVQLRDQVRELGTEVVALRHLRERAQVPRGTDRRCPQCQEPMQFGMTHYCRKTSEYTEGVAA